MPSQSIKTSFFPLRNSNSNNNGKNVIPSSRVIFQNSFSPENYVYSAFTKMVKFPTLFISGDVDCKSLKTQNHVSVRGIADDNPGQLVDVDEDDLCPVECVREFKTDDEFLKILDKAKKTNTLVVVDFYRTSCGSCKYIEQGFSKLCKGSGDEDAPVIFLKHNVIDEYDEQSEVAERLRIKSVPLFHFYKDGVLVESFATRDKERINAAIHKYTTPAAPKT